MNEDKFIYIYLAVIGLMSVALMYYGWVVTGVLFDDLFEQVIVWALFVPWGAVALSNALAYGSLRVIEEVSVRL
jgi:hypothetical protein